MANIFSWSRGRIQRATLRSLMSMDSRQLSDIGLTHADVADALRNFGAASELLTARRHGRSDDFMR